MDDLKNNLINIGAKDWFNIADPADITSDVEKKIHKLVDFYVGSTDNINDEHLQGLINLYTDALYLHPSYQLIGTITQDITVYQYILTYEGKHSLDLNRWYGVLEPIGVSHGDDLIYLWSLVDFANITLNKVRTPQTVEYEY